MGSQDWVRQNRPNQSWAHFCGPLKGTCVGPSPSTAETLTRGELANHTKECVTNTCAKVVLSAGCNWPFSCHCRMAVPGNDTTERARFERASRANSVSERADVLSRCAADSSAALPKLPSAERGCTVSADHLRAGARQSRKDRSRNARKEDAAVVCRPALRPLFE